jgi:hypothetical protein
LRIFRIAARPRGRFGRFILPLKIVVAAMIPTSSKRRFA